MQNTNKAPDITVLMPMYELSDKLKALRDEKDELEARKKAVESEIEKTDKELCTMMVDTETQNFTRAGFTFSLTNKVRASAFPDKKQDLFDALKKAGFGDLVYETVNANSLSAFVSDQIESNKDELPAWLEGLVKTYDQQQIAVRKSTTKKKKQ